MKNYFICHGSFGNSNEHYFPWLKEKLERATGAEVIVPSFPIGVNIQTFESWSKVLDQYIDKIGEDTVFVGRSIAPIFIVKYLLKNNIKIRALFAVSPFNNLTDIPAEEYNIVNSTFYLDDITAFKNLCKNIVCYISKNDPFVPYNYLIDFANTLDAETICIEDGGHFNTDSGYTTFEVLFDKIMDFNKYNKKVIITGASDGLGYAIATKYIKNGAKVINISRSNSDIKGIVNINADLTEEKDIEKAIKLIKEKHNDFDVLINNAAIVGREELDKLTYQKVDKTLKLNTIAPMILISELYQEIVKNKADIVNIGATISGRPGQESQLSYTTSKWGLKGVSQNVGMELKGVPSRMIYVNLGGMYTSMHNKDYGATYDNPKDWMMPDEVANIVIDTLNTPKNIEISEITINRKNARNR